MFFLCAPIRYHLMLMEIEAKQLAYLNVECIDVCLRLVVFAKIIQKIKIKIQLVLLVQETLKMLSVFQYQFNT